MLSKPYHMQHKCLRTISLFLLTVASCQIPSQWVQAAADPSHEAINSNKLVECITEAHRAVANLREGQPCFFVIGNTGSGKSTTIAYLQGAEMRKDRDPATGRKFITTHDQGVPTISSPKNNFNSQTRYPALFEAIHGRGYQGLLFCDTPGFKDTGTVEEKIARSLSLSMFLKKVKVKGILVVTAESEIDSSRGDNLKEVFKTLHLLLHNPVLSVPHLYFCFNKCDPDLSVDNIRNLLQDLVASASLEQAEQRMLATLLKEHPNNIFLVHPADGGTTRNTINQCLMAKRDGIPLHSFYYAADQLTLQQLSNWVHHITSTCTRIYKNIQRLKRLINTATSTIKTEKQRIDRCKREQAQVAGDQQSLQTRLQQLKKAKNQLEQRKTQLENDRTQIPFKKKVTKHKTETYTETRGGPSVATHLGGMGLMLINPFAGFGVMAGNMLREPEKVTKTRNISYEVDENIPYDSDGNPKETPSADCIIYGERRNHPTTYKRVAKLVSQLQKKESEFLQVQHRLSTITLSNEHLQGNSNDAQQRINAYNTTLQNYNREKQCLSSELESYRPQIAAVAKLRQMVSSENAGIFGPQTVPFFEILHTTNFSVSSLVAAGAGLMAFARRHR